MSAIVGGRVKVGTIKTLCREIMKTALMRDEDNPWLRLLPPRDAKKKLSELFRAMDDAIGWEYMDDDGTGALNVTATFDTVELGICQKTLAKVLFQYALEEKADVVQETRFWEQVGGAVLADFIGGLASTMPAAIERIRKFATETVTITKNKQMTRYLEDCLKTRNIQERYSILQQCCS